MRFAKGMLMSLGAMALAVAFLTFVAPKAAHAVVATLVQVSNTTANPAITQDVSKFASENVELHCISFFHCGQILSDGSLHGDYQVPAGHSLVITTIQVNTSGPGSFVLRQFSSVSVPFDRLSLTVSAAGSSLFQYPAGIVLSSGSFVNALGSDQAYLTAYIVSN